VVLGIRVEVNRLKGDVMLRLWIAHP
jgi:hypothetical protein